jgi:ABC-type multidrug transport system fused ATPase/permease subunit
MINVKQVGAFRGALPTFPKRDEETDELYADKLRDYATQWIRYFLEYYESRKWKVQWAATTFRAIAFLSMILGGVILVGRTLSAKNQQWLMESVFHTSLQEVPAEVGLVLLALAGGLMAADRFANLSENWMRYVVAMLSLQRMHVEFQMASVQTNEPVKDANSDKKDNKPPENKTQLEYDRIKNFLNAVFDLVQHETQEWADEFRKNRSELEGYLKVQNASRKPGTGVKRK